MTFVVLYFSGVPHCLGNGLCADTEATLDCLQDNFDSLYSSNYSLFWNILRDAGTRALGCETTAKTASFLTLTHIHSSNAEFNEYLHEIVEELTTKNPKCFFDSLTTLNQDTVRDVIALIRIPLFAKTHNIENIFLKNRDKERYKLIMDVYFRVKETHLPARDCPHNVALFLKDPNHKNYLSLQDNLPQHSDVCWLELKHNTGNLAKLYEHAKHGNEWAVRILIKHTSDLDGGELENAYRALGESLDVEPIILLREFAEQRMTENAFSQIVIMLPLSFVDDKKGILLALKARKGRIVSVKDAKFNRQKELAVKAISSQIRWILKEWP